MPLSRAYGRIQRQRRIAIPKHIMEMLGWEIDDQVLVEVYQGKLIVENLTKTTKPITERLYDDRG